MEDQELSSIVTLVDEDGKDVDFDHLMTFAHEEKHYVALMPLDPIEGVKDDEVVILEVREGDDEDLYVPIEDGVLLEEVFDTFLQLLDEEDEDD